MNLFSGVQRGHCVLTWYAWNYRPMLLNKSHTVIYDDTSYCARMCQQDKPKPHQSIVVGRSSVEVRRESLAKAVVASPEVIHLSNYRRRRRAKVGGPVVSLDGGIIQQRSYTDVASVVAFMIYAGIMVCMLLRIYTISISVWKFWHRPTRWTMLSTQLKAKVK